MKKRVDNLQIVDYNCSRKGVNEMAFTVKQARRYAGITQTKMAELLGLSVSAYARLEKKAESFTMARAVRFCKAVSLPLEEINFFTTEST